MTAFIKIYLITLGALLVADFVWLKFLSSGLYNVGLGDLARRAGEKLDPLWLAAILVYLIMAFGLAFFVNSRVGQMALPQLLAHAFLFGIIVYAVYDFTNLATLRDWSLKLSLIDMLWGGVVSTLTALAVHFIYPSIS